jgi:hypothetical protein
MSHFVFICSLSDESELVTQIPEGQYALTYCQQAWYRAIDIAIQEQQAISCRLPAPYIVLLGDQP